MDAAALLHASINPMNVRAAEFLLWFAELSPNVGLHSQKPVGLQPADRKQQALVSLPCCMKPCFLNRMQVPQEFVAAT